jgi:plasmid stability protein
MEEKTVAVTIRKIPVAEHRALKALAKAHGRTTEAELRALIKMHTSSQRLQKGLGTMMHALWRKHGSVGHSTARRVASGCGFRR